MAQPISFRPTFHKVHAAGAERLKNAPQEHAEALLSACAILQSLHDEGVLEIIRGCLGSRDKILQILVDAANTPASVQGIRNLVIVAKWAGTLDPKILEGVAQAVPEGLAAAAEPISLWSMLKRFCWADTRRALATGFCVLQSFGKALKQGDAR